MLEKEPICRRCDAKMQVGYALDTTEGAFVQSRWVSGTPEPAKVLGMKTGYLSPANRQVLPLLAYRCPNCETVEFFAPSSGAL